MHIPSVRHCLGIFLLCGFLCSCSTKQVALPRLPEGVGQEPKAQVVYEAPVEKPPSNAGARDRTCTERVITDEELWRISEKDPDLSPILCRQILARLNIKAHYYVSDDIEKRRRLKVPNDFSAYKDWTPLPRSISSTQKVSQAHSRGQGHLLSRLVRAGPPDG